MQTKKIVLTRRKFLIGGVLAGLGGAFGLGRMTAPETILKRNVIWENNCKQKGKEKPQGSRIMNYNFEELVGDSEIVIFSENHVDLRHYGFLADEMFKLKEKGFTHIFVEISESINPILERYQELRKKEIENEISHEEIEEMKELVGEIFGFVGSGFDIGRLGYFIRLLDSATFYGVGIVGIDREREDVEKNARRKNMNIYSYASSREGLNSRDIFMVRRINENGFGRAILLIGGDHSNGIKSRLGKEKIKIVN